MSRFDRLALYTALLVGLVLIVSCQALLAPIRSAAAIPPGHGQAVIQVQLPLAKGVSSFGTKATNDMRDLTLPAKMRLSVSGLDIDPPVEPSGDYQNPIPLATTTASVAMIVPLGRNLIIKAEGLTQTGETIASSVVKGVFSMLVDQGTTVAVANRLTTPVAEAMEQILAKQSLGPDEQRRSRNLLLSYDTASLQLFVQQQLLGGTGNVTTDLQRLADGRLAKHPGLVNVDALAKYVWEKAGVPPNSTFLSDAQGGGAFLSPGKITGVIAGVRPGVPVTVLCDDPVSKPIVIDGSSSFTIPSVRPGNWKVYAVANGYQPSITHFNGTGLAPAFYESAPVPAAGERASQDFTLQPIPATVGTVLPARGAISPATSNPAFVSLTGQHFGDIQDGAVIMFQNVAGGATVAANQIDTWSDSKIRVAVPTLSRGMYAIRIDRPTIDPGVFVPGTTQAVYAAGNWGGVMQTSFTAGQGLPVTADDIRLGVATSNDLRVQGQLMLAWNGILKGYAPTTINLLTGGIVPAVSFAEQATTTPTTASWAFHPDGRALAIWSTGTSLQARAFGISGTPLGGAYTLVPTSESSQTDCGPDAAAFDANGVLHLAYMAKSPDVLRPVYRRFSVNGLGVTTPLMAPLRLDTALSGSQNPPRLRLGRGGQALVDWLDSRTGVATPYFRVVNPDGATFATPEVVRASGITDLAIDSKGNVAVTGYTDLKLALYGPTGTLIGENVVGQWDSGGSSNTFYYEGLQHLLFDFDDHLIATGLAIQVVRNPAHFSKQLYVVGYVAGPSGFVADTWRPRGDVRTFQAFTTSVTPMLYLSKMVIGPDGTVTVCSTSDQFEPANQLYVIQLSWF